MTNDDKRFSVGSDALDNLAYKSSPTRNLLLAAERAENAADRLVEITGTVLEEFSGTFAYSPMSPVELADLSAEAGRPLTETEALEYLKRRTHEGAVQSMLGGSK